MAASVGGGSVSSTELGQRPKGHDGQHRGGNHEQASFRQRPSL